MLHLCSWSERAHAIAVAMQERNSILHTNFYIDTAEKEPHIRPVSKRTLNFNKIHLQYMS